MPHFCIFNKVTRVPIYILFLTVSLLKFSWKNKAKQLLCSILAIKQLLIIIFPWRLQIVKNRSVVLLTFFVKPNIFKGKI